MTASIRPSDDLTTGPPSEAIRHELRFALTDSMREEFTERARTGFASVPRREYSIYYDTPGGALWRQGIALRVAAIDGGYLQTVQVRASGDAAGGPLRTGRTPADPFDGLKWERVTLTPMPEPIALPPEGSPVGSLIRDCLPLLRPAFEIDLQRQTRIVVPEEGVRIDLACDVGVIRAADGASEAIDEAELAQQSGPDGIFHRYALQWARLHDASLLTSTRQARGMALAGYPPGERFPAPRPPIRPEGEVDVRLAARRVIASRLEQFIDHLPAVLESELPRGPRQLRVALRRLRAAVRFFALREDRQLARDQPWRAVDAMALELLAASAPLCRGDRLLLELLPVLEAAFPRDPALSRLNTALDDYRAASRAQLRHELVRPRTTEFVLLTAAALGTLDDAAPGAGRHATRLGNIADESPSRPVAAANGAGERPRRPEVAVPPAPFGAAADARRDRAGHGADLDDDHNAGDNDNDNADSVAGGRPATAADLTTVFDSNPGGVTVWEESSPAERRAALRFDSYAARRLAVLASRVHDLAGDAAVSDDWGPVHAALRRLRQALQVAGHSGPGQQRPQRLLARLRRWEHRLAGDREIEATRETVYSAMRRIPVTDSVMARVLGLVDGHWAFARQRLGGPGHPARPRAKASGRSGTDQDPSPPAPGDGRATAMHHDEALGPVARSRKLRKLLRRHFALEPGHAEETVAGPARPVEPAVTPSFRPPTVATPVAHDMPAWLGDDQVFDLGEHHRPAGGLIGQLDDRDLRTSATAPDADDPGLLLPPRRDPKRPAGPSNSELH